MAGSRIALGAWKRNRALNRGSFSLAALGDRARDEGDWASAAMHYRAALDLNPNMPAIWVQLGHAVKEQGDHQTAESCYRRSIALDEEVADTHLQLGHALKLQERYIEAVQSYDTALRLDPSLEAARSELATLSSAGGFVAGGDHARAKHDWRAAATCYQKALEIDPGLSAIWVQLGHALKEQGDYKGAEAAYRKSLELEPGSADTHLQLGHLFKLRGERAEAEKAYAAAVGLDPNSADAQESLRSLVGYSPGEVERALKPAGNHNASGSVFDALSDALRGVLAAVAAGNVEAFQRSKSADEFGPLSTSERYGPLFPEAARRSVPGSDVLWFGVIDWSYRIQRPQHLASGLAALGTRVFYISLVFEPADAKGRFRILARPSLGVYEVRLRITADTNSSIYQGLSEAAIDDLRLAVDDLLNATDIRSPIAVLDHPGWYPVAAGIPGATMVYDCLDYAQGFSNSSETLNELEAALVKNSDLAVVASQPLSDHLASHRPSVIVRNAAEVDFFAQAFSEKLSDERPSIGYFGAIAEWFEIDWIRECARARPDWRFTLIGRTNGCEIEDTKKLPNVSFLGERPYSELPEHLARFDVAIIPFKLTELIRCTNPVKLYEYMAAGKAVVASAMPEVIAATDLAYIAGNAEQFGERIAQALAEDSVELRRARQRWASDQNWDQRAVAFLDAMQATFPLVSIVVLTYNNWKFTEACLHSLRCWSDYPNFEIIVVDNASTDETVRNLRRLERRDERIRVILNDENLGFAAGNNVGLRAARGEYVIILNNDTFVTYGWIRDLIRPLMLDAGVGLVGPLTNNIGNEQKVKIAYRNMEAMHIESRKFVRRRTRETYEANNLAFFCVAMRKGLLSEVGYLDEIYGIGFFEDDDYCRRVIEKGYRLLIVDDVFVHHHLSASFQSIGTRAAEQMARNKLIFEDRWGAWQPHRYRREAGFG